jgi:DUF2075 family protein
MIIYQNTKNAFIREVSESEIDNVIANAFKAKSQGVPSKNELRSWRNSLTYMSQVLSDSEIPEDCGVAIEYKLPQTSKRIDFIVTGSNEKQVEHAILIELKQWESAEITDQDAVVRTYLNGGVREVSHPSYQAWSYAALLEGFNEAVYTTPISLKPCAYLHNYTPDGIIDNKFYSEYVQKAPVFLKSDKLKLRDFIKQFVKHGDKNNIMYRIEHGKIRPSKSLADSLASMLKGNEEFLLIDDQKTVYEKALSLSRKASESNKKVLIVEGGPGTGKTVVAINLLVKTTNIGLLCHYVTKNAAPRAVYETKLTGTFKKTHISNLFKGSGSYTEAGRNTMDVLIVDEAHRLNEQSGLYSNLGENQIKEIISTAKCSIFFIDEDQRVTLQDIGTKKEILKWARLADAEIHEAELASQFRCSGSDGYLAWLDNTLQIRETANDTLDAKDYDFRVFDSPVDLKNEIFRLNEINNKSRLVAGYCWDWKSKNDPSHYDIVIPGFNFKMKWNLSSYGSKWLIDPDSISEVGCIHTCQGLELDYVGVIIGNDFRIRNGKVVTDPTKRSSMDRSIRGFKNLLKQDRMGGELFLDKIIKNTYKTLMTRGIKGCFVYCTDTETSEYFKSKLQSRYVMKEWMSQAAEDGSFGQPLS